jgi:hypothetical protein
MRGIIFDALKTRPETLSAACASAGVLLIVLSAVAPDHWYPELALFLGLGLLVVSHVLTPCIDRIAVWRKQLLK